MHQFDILKIRAYLQTPVISDAFLPLDGILYYHMVRALFGPKTLTLARQGTVKEAAGVRLPFQRRNVNTDGEWYYACSFAQWPPDAARDKIQYAKRFDTELSVSYADFKGKRERVDTVRGEFKNYFVTEYTFNAPYVEWYCRAEKECLEKLLPFCTHIGKKGSQGCGSVLRWEVEATERDWYIRDNQNRVMRAIPSPGGDAVYGIRPSYWLPKHQFKVLLPK